MFRRPTSLFLIAFVFSLSLTLSIATIFAQDTSKTWLDDTQSPAVKKMHTFSESEIVEEKSSRTGFTNQSCMKKVVPISNTHKHDGCWYATRIGMLEKEGHYLLQPGERIAGRIFSTSTDAPTLHPTQNPNIFMQASLNQATGYGFFATFRTTETAQMARTTHQGGGITLTYEKPGVRLKAESGSSIHTQHSYIWQSENARWMVLMNEEGSFVRVNMSTLAMSSVKLREKPSGKWIPGSASISNDGKYVAAAVHGEQYSELYISDLSQCTKGERAEAVLPASKCPARTIKNVLKQHITAYKSITLPKFYDNHTLSIYHVDSTNQYTQYLLQAPNTIEATNIYMAMGDSFTSGEGAYNYNSLTDIQDQNLCHLSYKSYPYLLNQQFSLQTFNSVACSGARIDNITKKSQTRQTIADPTQFYIPGYKPQLQYIREGGQKPTIITLSVGGNDIGFADKIKHCVTHTTNCFDSYEDRLEIAQEIDRQKPRFREMLKQLKSTIPPNTKIYIIGYPSVINHEPSNECGINVRLSQKERKLANDITTYLNQTIQSVASEEKLRYIDTEDALSGSRLCEAPPMSIAMHGITHGNDVGIDKYKFLGKEGFHPNEKGQQLIKNTIIGQIHDFTHDAPIAHTASTPNPENLTQNTPKTGRPINKTIHGQTASLKGLPTDRKIALAADSFEYSLRPNTPYTIVFNSDVNNGTTVVTDSRGDLSATVTIPDTVTDGMFVVHIYGIDDAQQSIDIYQYIQLPDTSTQNDQSSDQQNIPIPEQQGPASTDSSAIPFPPLPHPSLRALLNTTSTPKILLNVSTTAHLGEQPGSNATENPRLDHKSDQTKPKVLELATETPSPQGTHPLPSSQKIYLVIAYSLAGISVSIFIIRTSIRKLNKN